MCSKYRIPPSLIGGKNYFSNDDGHILNANNHVMTFKFSPYDAIGLRGSYHPHLSIGGKELNAHRLICAARWGLPRKGQECHHLNGNKFDNRPMNLIWLSKTRHRLYDNRLRALKEILGQGAFLFARKDFIRFARMSDASFAAMLAKYACQDPLAAAAEEPSRDFDIFVERDD